MAADRNDAGHSSDAEIVDAEMTFEQAVFTNLPAETPTAVVDRLVLVEVRYYGLDRRLHRGQLVAHGEVADDLLDVFAVAYRERFPIASVIPISAPAYLEDGRWSDPRSMAANNTSAFNYRVVAGTPTLSAHAFGRAIDINPAFNPYHRPGVVEPPGAVYDPARPGTLTADHPVTRRFVELGWRWGGDFVQLKDYQHFEK